MQDNGLQRGRNGMLYIPRLLLSASLLELIGRRHGKALASCLWMLHLLTLRGHTGSVDRLSLNLDGTLLASCCVDRTVCVWDLVSGECLTTLHVKGYGSFSSVISCVSFYPSAQHLATSHGDGIVRIWRLSSQSCVSVLKGHLSKHHIH